MSNEGGLMAVGAFFLVVGAFDLFRARAFRDYCLRFLENHPARALGGAHNALAALGPSGIMGLIAAVTGAAILALTAP